MAVIDDIDQKCEGLLEIKDDDNIVGQFNSWMSAKNVSLNRVDYNSISQSNLVRNLFEIVNNKNLETPYDRCFDKDSFDRGGV